MVVFLAYVPCLNHDFVNWDDDVHLLKNEALRSLHWDNVRQIFLQTVNKIYVPLTTLTFAIEYQFFHFDPFVYHFDNLILHLGVVLLVFWFASLCGLTQRGALFAAMVFGLHPIHVESVAWVTERKDVLCSFFYLAALCFYIHYLRSKRTILFFAVILLSLLSVLAKPMALSLPLVLLVCDYFFQRYLNRRVIFEKLYLGIILSPVVWMTYLSHVRLPGSSVMESVLVWVWCFIFYIKKFFIPYDFFLLYKLPKPILISNFSYGEAAVIFILVLWALFNFHRLRWLIFAFAFYAASIFFVLRFDNASDANVVADRFMYIPSVGFCLLLGVAYEAILIDFPRLEKLNKGFYKSRFTIAAIHSIILAVLIGLFIETSSQIRVWRNGITLWEHQLKYRPAVAEALVYNKLAAAYSEETGFKRLVNAHRGSLKRFASKQILLGTTDRNVIEKIQRVMLLYKRAIKIKPDYDEAYYNLGRLYGEMDMPQTAGRLYQAAIRINPRYIDAYLAIAKTYEQLGDAGQAVATYWKALAVYPEYEGLYKNIMADLNMALFNASSDKREVYKEAYRKISMAFTQYLIHRK